MGEVITGKALAIDGLGEQRPYLRTKNVFDGRIDIDDVLSMPMTDDQFRQFMLQEGDILLNEGQSLELVGRCAIYGGEYPGQCAIQNQLLRFRAYAGVSGLFASHLFRYCQHEGVFARVALQTTSIAHLGGTRFERLLLPWPPTETEQCAIAAASSDMDAFVKPLGFDGSSGGFGWSVFSAALPFPQCPGRPTCAMATLCKLLSSPKMRNPHNHRQQPCNQATAGLRPTLPALPQAGTPSFGHHLSRGHQPHFGLFGEQKFRPMSQVGASSAAGKSGASRLAASR